MISLAGVETKGEVWSLVLVVGINGFMNGIFQFMNLYMSSKDVR